MLEYPGSSLDPLHVIQTRPHLGQARFKTLYFLSQILAFLMSFFRVLDIYTTSAFLAV